ncbi:MAG: phosphate/phosphite/phosphonate ABC transporter substrate-binding protein [Gammaproteobacteria bacterium]|nr:MAG: phosphate/phosphite/phosphonate ABC transporter substrate-binding protein [Gammaproteobacteria bacterium]
MITIGRFCFLLSLLTGFFFNQSFAAQAPLILGVHPYLPASEINTRFQPLTDYLSKTLGQPITIRVGRDYEDHIRAVGMRNVDIAYMGPSLYIKLVDEFQGQWPLLARLEVNGKPELFGAIVVRRDSPFTSLAELKGHSFAFGDPDSTMSHIVPQGMLQEAGVPLSQLSGYKFLGAHKNVALGVLAGDFDAGGVKMEILNEYENRGLRLLARSPAVSEHLLLARPDMPAEQITKLRQALLNLNNTAEGKHIMSSIHKQMTAFVPAVDADYNGLRKLMHAVESGN